MMQKSLVAAMLAAALGVGSPARAADIYAGQGPSGPSIPLSPWNGFYGGVNGGYAWNTGSSVSHVGVFSDCDGIPSCVVGVPLGFEKLATNPEGGFGGGQVGYNWQAGPWVFGFETDFQGAGVRGSRVLRNDEPIAIDNGSSSLDWFGTVRGRLGFTIFNSALLYATGGFAYGGVEDKGHGVLAGGLSDTQSSSQTATGYVVGAGLEYAFTPQWSVKVEYQYMNLGDTTLTGGTGGFVNPFAPPPAACSQGMACLNGSHELNSEHAYDTVRIGLNYHFLPVYVPLK